MTDVTEIDGVGNSKEDKLEDIGITTVNGLANASFEELEDAGVRNAQKILDRARKQGAIIKDGDTIEEEQSNATYVSSGMQDVDRMLGGGFQGGYLIGVSGESKAGKTQFCLQALGSAADLAGNAVYIETEPNRFQMDRVKTLLRDNDSIDNIYRIKGYDPDSDVENTEIQKNAYEAVRENFDDVAMIVVDSFIANFRLSSEFTNRSDLPKRSTMIGRHLEILQSISNEFDCPILMTLQIQGDPDPYGSNISVWGPTIMDHTITYIIHMSHAKGELKEAELKGHPGLPDDSVTLKIPENDRLEVA